MNELDEERYGQGDSNRGHRNDMIRPMHDRTIRAYLRGAVGEPHNILHGWYHYGRQGELRWVIYKQADGSTQTMKNAEIEDFVDGLYTIGVKARWRL